MEISRKSWFYRFVYWNGHPKPGKDNWCYLFRDIGANTIALPIVLIICIVIWIIVDIFALFLTGRSSIYDLIYELIGKNTEKAVVNFRPVPYCRFQKVSVPLIIGLAWFGINLLITTPIVQIVKVGEIAFVTVLASGLIYLLFKTIKEISSEFKNVLNFLVNIAISIKAKTCFKITYVD